MEVFTKREQVFSRQASDHLRSRSEFRDAKFRLSKSEFTPVGLQTARTTYFGVTHSAANIDCVSVSTLKQLGMRLRTNA